MLLSCLDDVVLVDDDWVDVVEAPMLMMIPLMLEPSLLAWHGHDVV